MWWIRRTGVYALLDRRILLACKERDAGQARLAGSKAVEDNSEQDWAGCQPSYSVEGFV